METVKEKQVKDYKQVVIDSIRFITITDIDELDLNFNFEDLNMGSLEVIETIMEIEKELQISIPDDKVAFFNTPNDIVKYLESR